MSCHEKSCHEKSMSRNVRHEMSRHEKFCHEKSVSQLNSIHIICYAQGW